MNELAKINVTYDLPRITTDLAELENGIHELEIIYTGWVVRESDLPTAKKNTAELNKIAKAISDKRIEIAKAIKAPIDAMETELKALTSRITVLSLSIKAQTDAYESKRRYDRQAEILAFPEWVGDYMLFDEKWLNATATDKAIKENMAAQKQFFTNNALLITSTCNGKGLDALKYLDMLVNHREVAEIVATIESDSRIKAQYASTTTATPTETPVTSVEDDSDIYEFTVRFTATKRQQNALKDFITKNGIKYEVVE